LRLRVKRQGWSRDSSACLLPPPPPSAGPHCSLARLLDHSITHSLDHSYQYTGPCLDDGQEVLGLAQSEVAKIDKELQAPSPKFNGACQQLPQVFLDSGTADSGANFDELWDVAMNSPCATDPNLEWMGRDCRDSFIPGKVCCPVFHVARCMSLARCFRHLLYLLTYVFKGMEGVSDTQDRSDPNQPCTLECATLYLKIAELCPRVYQLLRLNELAPICPELQSVTIEPLAGGPVPIDGSYTVAQAPAVAQVPTVAVEAPAPIVAVVPAPLPVEIPPPVPAIIDVQVPTPAPVEIPAQQVVVAVAPAPSSGTGPALVFAFFVSVMTHCTLQA
jgi:hypothetical protein